MNRIYTLLTAIVLTIAATAQTLNVQVGNVTYQFPASQTGDMTYDNGSTLTIMDKTFDLSDISSMTVDQSQVTDNQVRIIYDGTTATVQVAGNIAPYVTASINGAHVTIDQSNTDAVNGDEITYQLSGTSTNGSLTLNGSYKCTVSLAGVTLANPTGAAINITNSKRIQLSAKKETVNTISDGSGSQKACIYSKGQLQFQGNGTLNVAGNCKHAVKSASYITVKNITINITSAVSDGFSCEEYFQLKSGTVTISGTGDDGIQCDLGGTTSTGETQDHSDEDTGNIYIDGGTLNITATADTAKGIKADGDVKITDGILNVNQTGNIIVEDDDISYPTSVKSTGDIIITGGSITINNTAEGGKALSADGNISIDESNATTVIDITANGKGGTAETSGSSSGETATSYKIYISFPTSGGGGGPGQQSSGGSSAKGIKVQGTIYLYGGSSEVYTSTNGAEGLESKTAIYIQGGKHYFNCYDDCINSSGKIYFNGGVTVCYGYGNDAVDSNAGTTGAITIGDGTIFTYTTAGSPEEGFDCDNNSYIQITGNGIGISAGGAQGGGSSSSTISNAKQGYAFVTSSLGYQTGRYYTLANSSGTNLVTYSFQSNCTSSLSFFTAKGMASGSSYNVKYSTSAPTDATTTWHGLYLGSTATGTSTLTTFTAK